MSNLGPESAERPDDLVVYGGTGRAARDWKSFDAIVRTLQTLREDETMLQMTSDSWVVQLVADVPGALHRAVRSVRS